LGSFASNPRVEEMMWFREFRWIFVVLSVQLHHMYRGAHESLKHFAPKIRYFMVRKYVLHANIF
jgi:hypothetical protein